MKKAAAVLLLLILSFSAFASMTDYRNNSMGMLKSAVNSDSLFSFANPGLVFFAQRNNKLAVSGNLDFRGYGEIPLIENSGLSATFLGKNILLNFDIEGYPEKQASGLYNLYRNFDLEAKLAIGYKAFSVGVGFKGGSSSVRKSVELQNKVFSGLVGEAFFTRYKRQEDSYQIEISAGLVYKYKGFCAGLLCENIFEDSWVSRFEVTKDSVLNSMDAGVYWTKEHYGKRGRLNRNIFSFGLELQKIWSDSERTVNAGFEYLYQLTRTYNVAIRLGTQYLLADNTESVQTAGLAFGFGRGEFSVSCQAPYRIYYENDLGSLDLCLAFDLVF